MKHETIRGVIYLPIPFSFFAILWITWSIGAPILYPMVGAWYFHTMMDKDNSFGI